MIGPLEKKPPIRIAGYLEKRGKMRLVVCRWKRWWFVLEGRLLLYYKSQLEYANLSPCRGSLNLGLASSVRPNKGLELTVITRAQTVTLRATNKMDHEQWLQSLVDAMALPNTIHSLHSKPVFLRYANQEQDNLIERIKHLRRPGYIEMPNTDLTLKKPASCETSTSTSDSSGLARSQQCMLRRVLSDSRSMLQRPYKRVSVRRSMRLSKAAFSDTSIPASTLGDTVSPNPCDDKCQSMQDLRDSFVADDGKLPWKNHLQNSEKAALTDKRETSSNSIKIELNLEGVKGNSENHLEKQKIGKVKVVLDGCDIYGTAQSKRDIACKSSDKIDRPEYLGFLDRKKVNLQLLYSKEARSDTDLTIRRRTRGPNLSYENMHALDRSIGSTYQDSSAKVEVTRREQRTLNCTIEESPEKVILRKPTKKRSNSILTRFLDGKGESDGDTMERGGTIRKRLSFLRKVWKKREKKPEENVTDTVDHDQIPVVVELPSPDMAEDILMTAERQEAANPGPEPPPDYDVSIPEEQESPPVLPPRHQERPPSPWHDVPKNNQPVNPPEDEVPPPIPMKTLPRKRKQDSAKTTKDSSGEPTPPYPSLEADSQTCEPPSTNGDHKLEDLDTLLAQLSEVNASVVRQIDVSEHSNGNDQKESGVADPDYDIPRAHASLAVGLRFHHARSDTFPPTQFLCTSPLVDMDSLDPVINRLDAEMVPDSLECDMSWSVCHIQDDGWTRPSALSDSSHSGSMLQHFITSDERHFPDSLTS